MKQKIYYIFLCLMTCIVMHAQEDVYIYNGNDKEFFEVNNSVKYIKCYGKHDNHVKKLFDLFPTTEQVMPDVFKITLSDPNLDLFNRIIPEIDSVFVADELIYKGDGTKQCCFNHILLQTKGSVDLKGLLESHGIPYISFERFGLCENEYILKLSISEALFYANKLVETGYFVYAQPSFYRFDILQNPMYPYQWGLKNTGQHNGEVGMDINVEPAWELATGEGITVAVIDGGVQLDHPDLQNNLLQGYDATGGGGLGGYSGTDNHGTCCAGIIAACDNNIGIKGIAYKAKIIPIRIAFGYNVNDEYTIMAFNHAYSRGVDIISCSWTGGSENQMLTNTINYVAENGRNGLGTPVVFSSGNYEDDHPSTTVRYPANLSSTIAVGAINYCGERKSQNSCDGEDWGSNYGFGLDVVAPGVLIPTTTINSGYTYDFNGTSAACPHAAGVMALILSANPCLTQSEARQILHLSCDKLDPYGFCFHYGNLLWNYEVGYGKINAYKAVLYSLALNHYNISAGGNLVSTTNNVELILDDGYCSDFSTGLYYCNQYEYSATINFPNMNDPHIIVSANGLSDITNYNNGDHYTRISSLTNTSAVLTTWKYYIQYNAIGQQINTYIPSNNNVTFYATIVDVPQNYIHITNQNITNGIFNRYALKNLYTNNTTISGSAEASLIARDSIVFQNGTTISPSTGYLRAYIESFNPCLNNKNNDHINIQTHDTYINHNNTLTFENENNTIPANNMISISPNPNNGSFYVALSNNEDEITGIKVFDTMGKIIYSNNRFNGGEIVLPNAKQGLYYVVVTLKDKTITEKIIIQ